MSDTIDYSKTLNLPKTEFSMRAGLTQKEPAYLQMWEEQGVYAEMREKSAGKKQYILHDGPPYANGNIHIGHALNKVLKDLIVKAKTMQGFDSLYVPGWDCHGLPIEHQLFKELKKRKEDIDCVEFRRKAHDYAMKYVEIQKEQFKRLGIFGQWDDPYLTLDPKYEYWILKSLKALNEKGYIYRGLKPVNWCSKCETALAEAEVEYEDHTSPSVFVKFKVENQALLDVPADKELFLLVWTTTPWTLLANVAVAVHSAFQYSLLDTPQGILIVENSLRDAVMEKSGITDCRVIKEVEGKDLTKLTYVHPFKILEKCRVVTADYVTKEDGTGLVHTAPGHGQDDYETGLKNNLDVLMPVNDKGIYTDKAGKYAGLHVFKANPQVIQDLKEQGVLVAQEDIAHSYPHCWRCKSPIIFRATEQWFFKIDHDDLRKRLNEAIQDDVTWIPEGGKERISGMVAMRPDWCLSRQRYWGVPIPAVECEGCGKKHKLFDEVIDALAEIVKEEGTNAWFQRDISDFIPKGFVCPDCQGVKFSKTFDILDVWFDSGVSNQAVVKAKMGMEIPIDLYLEGSDQHRGWFQSSLIPAIAIEGKPPFKNVLTHGFVVDGQGRKMSKSLGNVISPLDIIKKSGADILRLWIASSSYNEDIRVSQEILDRLVDAYRKIRNTFRFLLGNLNGFDPARHVLEYKELLDLDQWALFQLSKVGTEIEEHYDRFEFAKVTKKLYVFCNEVLSSFYLDILKDRLYTSATNSQERRSAQTVLFHIINYLVRLMAPILCFTSEEIFKAMPKDSALQEVKSVHLLSWLKMPQEWVNEKVDKKYELLVGLRPHVLKALEDQRREGVIGSSLEAKVIFETTSERDFEYLTQNKEILPASLIVSAVEIVKKADIVSGVSEEFSKTFIRVENAGGHKCARCWNYFEAIGEDPQHPGLCDRCTQIVKEYAK